MRLAEVLERQASERPDVAAVISAHGERTYAELARDVDAFAAGLRGLGLGAGATVGLLCTNRIEWVVAALGTVVAGGRVAAFNTWSKRWDLDHLLGASQCDALVSVLRVGDADLEPVLRELVPEAWDAAEPGWRSSAYPALRELVVVGDEPGPPGGRAFASVAEAGPDELEAGTPHDDVALVLYTSGSTARPKAVPLEQSTALEHGWDVGVRMGVRDGERIWLPVPLFWSYGGGNALMVSLVHGCTLVLQERFDPGEALELIERHRCTLAYTLANITAALLADPGFAPERVASLERGMTIGTKVDVQAAATGLGIEGICNAYGSTEIYGCCTATPHDWPLERKATCQGPPLPRIGIAIADPESGASLPPGEVGEITVVGQVTRGYLGQPDANARAFTAAGEYRSGDLGHVDADGNLFFAARAGEMIKSGGINIAPAEVEEFLSTHPAVGEVAVTGTDDDRQGEVAIAFVVLAGSATADEEELRGFCREHIASFKVPARIVIVDESLPTTSTGKLARTELRAMADAIWARGTAAA